MTGEKTFPRITQRRGLLLEGFAYQELSRPPKAVVLCLGLGFGACIESCSSGEGLASGWIFSPASSGRNASMTGGFGANVSEYCCGIVNLTRGSEGPRVNISIRVDK